MLSLVHLHIVNLKSNIIIAAWYLISIFCCKTMCALFLINPCLFTFRAFFERTILCNSLVWSCSLTAKSNQTKTSTCRTKYSHQIFVFPSGGNPHINPGTGVRFMSLVYKCTVYIPFMCVLIINSLSRSTTYMLYQVIGPCFFQ